MQPSVKPSICYVKKTPSDEEDDLEALRMAALQSIKKQTKSSSTTSASATQVPLSFKQRVFNGIKESGLSRSRFHMGGRSGRNGLQSRVRNSNLISVPTVKMDQPSSIVDRKTKLVEDTVPKLKLPQDRYCKTVQPELKNVEASSKFDRYNDSDDTESESDSDIQSLSSESCRPLERTSSLEALMLELENEIKGQSSKEVDAESEHVKKKFKKSRKKNEIVLKSAESAEPVKILDDIQNEKKNSSKISDKSNLVYDKSKIDSENSRLSNVRNDTIEKSYRRNNYKNELLRQRSFTRSKSPGQIPNLLNLRVYQPDSGIPQNVSYINPAIQVVPLAHSYPLPAYNSYDAQVAISAPLSYEASRQYGYRTPLPAGLNSQHLSNFSLQYERVPSPISIKTDVLHTISAPLSPRSAAFVMQNREIIEKRKKSPRRSYSPSPPPFRRSPARYTRNSTSPPSLNKKHSPDPKACLDKKPALSRKVTPIRRFSPDVQSSTSVKHKPSPTRRLSPKRSRKSPQHSNLQRRIANQTKPTETPCEDKELRSVKRQHSASLSVSPSPERVNSKSEKPNEKVDPLLEARKRKFETINALPITGVIRLKPKLNPEKWQQPTESRENGVPLNSTDTESHQEDITENKVLGGDDADVDFNLKVDDIFSDEESDSENEGRFKTCSQISKSSTTVLSFTKLVSTNNKIIKETDTEKDKSNKIRVRSVKPNTSEKKDGNSRYEKKVRDQSSPHSQNKIANKEMTKNERLEDKKFNVTTVLKEHKRPITLMESKKIEIKIKNPSKYETENCHNYKVAYEKGAGNVKTNRKIEIASFNKADHDKETVEESEIIIDNEDDDRFSNKSEGFDSSDLRTQLSRKRAERQCNLPKERVASRLLRHALQSAVFKKSKKTKLKKSDKELVLTDGKLPIHLRLGIVPTSNADAYKVADSKSHKTSSRKRSKNRGSFDQV